MDNPVIFSIPKSGNLIGVFSKSKGISKDTLGIYFAQKNSPPPSQWELISKPESYLLLIISYFEFIGFCNKELFGID